ncbi:carboxylesterase/lipase family protein [Streptomyces sp. 351MFTsu5.1]|uniref:carboxylesterase/lipase family protein n=1 Tax=Streptomyces sp. 351MFTsu5.1 TaxID=1172180 RepID=UPI000372B4DE|nr:carboxylesterase family protein [Streptomyces sp. 351MFTsu5.1]
MRTRYGRVKGEQTGAVRSFKGIPYAAPPVGADRFRAPRAPQPWTGVRNATVPGHPCVQDNPDFPAWLDPEPESEDCLHLNVWTPASCTGDAKARPVMLWIHGGAFGYGSAGAPTYDGARLAEVADVVVVSVNHRLNVFGYLWLGDAVPELAEHANPGQRDLVAALHWVRENIGAFGGDPGNVTAFGESGGGAKINALLAAPSARGLVHKAIVQSGSQLAVLTREQANEVTDATFAALGGGKFTESRLRKLSSEELKQAARTVESKLSMLAFQPVVDGCFIPDQTWTGHAPAGSRGIPMMIGTTSHETAVFLPGMTDQIDTDTELRQRFDTFGLAPTLSDDEFARLLAGYRRAMPSDTRLELLVAMTTDLWMWHSALIQAELKQSTPGPVYFYEFAWRTPCFGSSWAVHAGELPFVLGNLTYPTAWDGSDSDAARSADDPTGQRFVLADRMMHAWGAFARSGDPSTADLAWPAYNTRTRPTLVFDRGSASVVSDRNASRRHLIEGLPTVW